MFGSQAGKKGWRRIRKVIERFIYDVWMWWLDGSVEEDFVCICSSLLGRTRHHDQFHSKHTSTCCGGKPGWTIVQTQVIVYLNMREDSWLGRYFGVVYLKIQETNPTLFGFDTRETIQRHPNFIISGELYSLIFWLLKVSKAISISYFASYECFRISYYRYVSFLQ